MGKFSRLQTDVIFLRILLSRKNKKNISKGSLLKFLLSMHSVKLYEKITIPTLSGDKMEVLSPPSIDASICH